MQVKIISFTGQGLALSKKIAQMKTKQFNIYAYPKFIAAKEESRIYPVSSLDAWTKEHFDHSNALIFIGAAGIALRAVAPYIRDKFSDPAVLCIDEKGQFVIPLLSGHVGGANELAREVAAFLKACPVITTASDVNHKWAVDVWAKKQGLFIGSREYAKKISAKILANEEILIKSDFTISGSLPKQLYPVSEQAKHFDIYISYKRFEQPDFLHLIPPCLCLGLGCKKGTDPYYMQEIFARFLREQGIDERAISCLASIALKKEEPAILYLAKQLSLPCRFFESEELKKLQGDFTSSAFVESIVEVDNVCERSACMVFPRKLICKQNLGGITMALSIDDTLSFTMEE